MVRLLPRLTYHSEEELEGLVGPVSLHRSKREPVTALTLSILLGASLARLGTGAATLVIQQQRYPSLHEFIDEDVEKLEFQITHLQESLTSLAEVVLQNRRGLDLIFLKEKGSCAALGEECCFYTGYSGIVKDSVVKVREGMAHRKREREANHGWFEAWYSKSPWFTTLISSLLGPLIILVLLLTFRPCILSWYSL